MTGVVQSDAQVSEWADALSPWLHNSRFVSLGMHGGLIWRVTGVFFYIILRCGTRGLRARVHQPQKGKDGRP